jgi:hypothetical protein
MVYLHLDLDRAQPGWSPEVETKTWQMNIIPRNR